MVAKVSKFGKKRNRPFENAVASAVFVIMLFGIMGFFIYQNVKMGEKRSDLENRLSELQAQMQELTLQEAMLKESIAETQTQEHEEKVLREQGLYKKQGEEVVTILPPENPVQAPGPEEQGKEKRWWNPWTWQSLR